MILKKFKVQEVQKFKKFTRGGCEVILSHRWVHTKDASEQKSQKTETKGAKTMGATIPQTSFEVFEDGMYRAKLAVAALEDSEYGTQVAVRFDLTEQGFEDKSIRAWASAKLSGGKRPSKLYTWTSALLFGGKPLPEGFDLDIDHLVGRETLLVLESSKRTALTATGWRNCSHCGATARRQLRLLPPMIGRS